MELFDQLEIFSHRYFDSLKIEERESPWGADDYDGGGDPIGAILHFTADNDLDRVTKWFMRFKYAAKASAHVIIADRKYGSVASMMNDLPLVKDLPVTVIQCQRPEFPTAHATWANGLCYGIELLNMGELRERDNIVVSHWDSWTQPWQHPLKQPQQGWQRLWEPYTVDQVRVCIRVLRELREMYPSLDPSWVVGHENVQGRDTIGVRGSDKRDPGPLLPIRQIREAVFGNWDYLSWQNTYAHDPDFCAKDRSLSVQLWAQYKRKQADLTTLNGLEGAERNKFQAQMAVIASEIPSAVISWSRFETAFKAMVDDGHSGFGAVGKVALRLLGYYVPNIEDAMDDCDRKALWLFQKLSGLKTDHIPGPQTRKMLQGRLVDRGIL